MDTQKQHINQVQKDMMLEFLKKHPKLNHGKFTNEFTFKSAQCLWEQITLLLNNVENGARKNWKQWRKTWQDMKKNVKSKKSKLRVHSNATGGGGPSEITIDNTESEILSFISDSVIHGQSGIEQSNATFNFEESIPINDVIDEIEVQEIEGPLNSTQTHTLAAESRKVEVDLAPEDHAYNLEYPIRPRKKTVKLTKTRRLENSLKLSQILTKSVEKRNDVLENYYEEKTSYLKHKKRIDEEQLNVKKEEVSVQREILTTLKNIEQHFLKKNSFHF